VGASSFASRHAAPESARQSGRRASTTRRRRRSDRLSTCPRKDETKRRPPSLHQPLSSPGRVPFDRSEGERGGGTEIREHRSPFQLVEPARSLPLSPIAHEFDPSPEVLVRPPYSNQDSGGALCRPCSNSHRRATPQGGKWGVSDPDTGKRVSRPNPSSALVTTAVPQLRIVDDELWEQVKARQAEMRRVTSNGDPRRFNQARRPKFLFSGLTKCAECGGGYVMYWRDAWRASAPGHGAYAPTA
jgi:hypothetical protein